ncbi:methyl-accepting chemotaxis protein [uncultured Clostridium sp.]|uniref:methyl-accepting chemotaxis protein n=1 Tax=uncultured Clostridium sp. TaxID=59620 RepID=UPI0025D48472|nr:methyl-accepting chemotaxis protein [uncultured Clostridium sp.]
MENSENSIAKFNKRTLKAVLIIYMASCIVSFFFYTALKILKINDEISFTSLIGLAAIICCYGVVLRICYIKTNNKGEFNKNAFYTTKGVVLGITYFHYLYLNFTMHLNSQWLLIFYFVMLGAMFFDVKLICISIVLSILCQAIIFIKNPVVFFGTGLTPAEIVMKVMSISLALIGILLIVCFSDMLLKEISKKEGQIESENKKLVNLFDSISEIATTVYESSESLSSGIEQQTGSLEEVSNASQIVSNDSNDMLEKSKENKQSLNKLLKANEVVTKKTDESGNRILEFINITEVNQKDLNNTLRIIQDISDNINTTFNSTKELEEKSSQVDDIMKLIREISEQTNLLALNASIEAARAGEYGKGFAVVADEIRQLAEGTNKSLNDVSTIINQLKQNINSVQQQMSANNEKSQQGNKIIKKAVDGIDSIISSLKEFSNNIREIDDASNTLLKETKRIVDFNEDVEDITKNNISKYEAVTNGISHGASANEEIQANINELRNIAETMTKLIK